jgi:hypothetical protein
VPRSMQCTLEGVRGGWSRWRALAGSGDGVAGVIVLMIALAATWRLSSISSQSDESASRPLCGFWCLNDKIIKELISFAKCET